jgi:hypothetical protein
VTTQETPAIDAVELARTYIHRWPAQENIIKDYLLPLGLDTNHGFAKVAVENSEVTKRRTHLERRLTRLKQWAQSAGKREAQASRRRERLRTAYTRHSKELYCFPQLTLSQLASSSHGSTPSLVLKLASPVSLT